MEIQGKSSLYYGAVRGNNDSRMSSGEIGEGHEENGQGRDVNDGTNIIVPLAISLILGKEFGSRREFDLRYKFREARENQRKLIEGTEIQECGPGGEGFRTKFGRTIYFKTLEKLVVLSTMYDSQRPNSFSLSEVTGRAIYYRLKLLTYGLPRKMPIFSVCKQEGEDWFLSHQLLLQGNNEELGLIPGDTVAGIQNGADGESLVMCLPCSTWPPTSFSMVQRPRRSGWPPQDIINKMVRKGCFVVPSDDVQDNEMVFMLSFAVPEMELMRSLNQTQINIYGYWLTILEQKVPQSLKPYLTDTVVKHCLFWILQDYPQDTWIELNVTRCMKLLLAKLIEVTRNRSCPNFFVKRYDLFMNMTPIYQVNLLNFLQTIEQTGNEYFLRLEPFCQHADHFHDIASSFPQMCIRDHEEERRLDFAFFQEVFHTYIEMRRLFEHAVKSSTPFDLDVFKIILQKLDERSSPLLDENIKRVLKAYLSLLMACHQCKYITNVGDKRSTDIDRIKELLKEGQNADVSSAKLKKATLCLFQEEPQECIAIIEELTDSAGHVIDLDTRWSPSGWKENHQNDRAYELSACNKALSRAEKSCKFMALPLDITWNEFHIVPDVIQRELEAVRMGRITCNPFVYSRLLRIFSKHKLGENIENLVKEFSQLVEKYIGITNVPHVYYNWLGYCLKLVGNIPEARQCFEKSLNIKGSDNAAEKHLTML